MNAWFLDSKLCFISIYTGKNSIIQEGSSPAIPYDVTVKMLKLYT